MREAAAIALLVGGLAMIDLLVPHLNFPLAYAVPLLMYSRRVRRRNVAALVLLLVALTYAGYFLGVKGRLGDGTFKWHFYGPGMINRSLVAGSLVLIAAVSAWWRRLRLSMQHWGAALLRSDEDRAAYAAVIASFEWRFATVISALLIVTLGITDWLTPQNFNIPILYFLPILVCAGARSRPLLWI